MDIVTLIVTIIVLTIAAALFFRLISVTLKFASLLLLLICAAFVIGTYLQMQAFIMTSDNQAFLTITPNDVFVVTQSNDVYKYDEQASATLKKMTNSTIDIVNTKTYNNLKDYANSPTFLKSDIVWYVDARQKSSCNQAAMKADASSYLTSCTIKEDSFADIFIVSIKARQSILKKVPLKSNIGSWLKNKFFS